MKFLLFPSFVLFGSLAALGDYVVDEDLGVVGPGEVSLVGSTVGGNNNSVYPKGIFTDGPSLNWGNEVVFRFELLEPATLSLTSNSIFGDADFFLLDGLATSIDLQSGKLSADNAIAAALLDGFPPETEPLPAMMPGVYYIVVEHFLGRDGQVFPGDTDFDVTLTVGETDAFDFPIDLGHVARAGSPITFDTLGSAFDTELAVYDEFGALLAENDDAGGGTESAVTFPDGLSAGFYYVVLAGSDTVFSPDFVVSSGGETGAWIFNFPLGPNFGPGLEFGDTDPAFVATETQVFTFLIEDAPLGVIDLGTIAQEDAPFSIDTIGSSFDTQLGIYDSEGFLLDFNDDIDFNGGNYLSRLNFPAGLLAGEYFLALAGYPNFYGDGFFVTVDTRIAGSSEGGNFILNHPMGPTNGSIAPSSQEWFSFTVGMPSVEGIRLTSVEVNEALTECTVTWESGLAGPFNIFVGDADDLVALGAPPLNVLPALGAAGVTSPATFPIPAGLQGASSLFIQVTD